MQRAGLVPGEQTTLTLDLQNPNRVMIKRIDVCFIQRYEIEQCRRRLEMIRLSIPQFNNVRDAHIETVCPLTIPLGIPPSFSYRSKGTRTPVHVELHYDLKLEIKAKGLFTDFDLQVPVIIGTDSAEYSSYPSIESALLNAMSMIALNYNDEDTPPPSYDSIKLNGVSSQSF